MQRRKTAKIIGFGLTEIPEDGLVKQGEHSSWTELGETVFPSHFTRPNRLFLGGCGGG